MFSKVCGDPHNKRFPRDILCQRWEMPYTKNRNLKHNQKLKMAHNKA